MRLEKTLREKLRLTQGYEKWMRPPTVVWRHMLGTIKQPALLPAVNEIWRAVNQEIRADFPWELSGELFVSS